MALHRDATWLRRVVAGTAPAPVAVATRGNRGVEAVEIQSQPCLWVGRRNTSVCFACPRRRRSRCACRADFRLRSRCRERVHTKLLRQVVGCFRAELCRSFREIECNHEQLRQVIIIVGLRCVARIWQVCNRSVESHVVKNSLEICRRDRR